jgi:phosphoglycerate dehydrogenase-like enzyme
MSDSLSIVVLREDVGPASVERYAETLSDRLSAHDVALARTPHEERRLIRFADVAAGVSLDEALLDHAEDLALFACSWTGTGHLPLDALADRGVAVTNASGVHAPGLAAQAMGYLLIFARNLHRGWHQQRDRRWEHFRAGELDDSTVIVVGQGSIGQAIVDRLSGFDIHTVGVRHSPEKGAATDEVIGYDGRDVHDALSRSDYVVLACPLTETTRGLLDREAFLTLPPSAVVVHVSRGAVVDTDALLWALREGSIRGAALDVTDPEPLPPTHPLWGFENVLVTPHIGGETPKLWERLGDLLARNVERAVETGEFEDLENQVV